MRHRTKRDWLARLAVLGLLASGITQAAWMLVDDFSNGLGNWTVTSSIATITTGANTLGSGPSGTVVKLDMSSTSASKYAVMTTKSTISRGSSDLMKVAFDLGYKTTGNGGYWQALSLSTSSNSQVNRAGHLGTPNSYEFALAVGGETSFSPTSTGQLTNTWYHYEMSMTAAQTILNAYFWASNDPAYYASQTPVWTTTISTAGIDTASYNLKLWVLKSTGAADGSTTTRDLMYADNVYYSVPEPAALALLGLGALGLAGRRRRR